MNTFTVAGTSVKGTQTKVRFSNELEGRIAMLTYDDHTDITLVELPNAMTKLEAASYIATVADFQDEAKQEAIQSFIEKNTPRPAAPRGRPMKLPTLADVPNRANGKFIAKAVREQMLEQLIADTIAEKEAAAAKRKARAAAKAAEEATA